MFTNPDFIKRKYKCNKLIANYLIYKLHMPLLGIDGKDYYFSDSPLLQEVLQKMPFWLKIMKRL